MSTSSTYSVTGMTCGHCVASVTEEVRELPGVQDVQVELGSGQLRVTSSEPIDPALVRQAVQDAGYQLAS